MQTLNTGSTHLYYIGKISPTPLTVDSKGIIRIKF